MSSTALADEFSNTLLWIALLFELSMTTPFTLPRLAVVVESVPMKLPIT